MNKTQEEMLKFFGQDYKVLEEHKDGNLTIESDGVKYIITKDGEFFVETHPKGRK